jgi:hypothetical protein
MINTLFGSVPAQPSLLDRLKSGIAKTRSGLVSQLETAFAGRKEIDADLLEELEYTLVSADIGVRTSGEILEIIRQRVDRKLVNDAEELRCGVGRATPWHSAVWASRLFGSNLLERRSWGLRPQCRHLRRRPMTLVANRF